MMRKGDSYLHLSSVSTKTPPPLKGVIRITSFAQLHKKGRTKYQGERRPNGTLPFLERSLRQLRVYITATSIQSVTILPS